MKRKTYLRAILVFHLPGVSMPLFCQWFSMRPHFFLRVFAGWILAVFPNDVQAQDGPAVLAALEDGLTKIIEDAEPSVVSIARINKNHLPPHDLTGEGLPPGMPSSEQFTPSEFGAGIVFTPADQPGKIFILTMYHVVKGGHIAGRGTAQSDDLVIHTHKRQKAQAEIIAADPRSDLAVLQIKSGEKLQVSDLKPIRLINKPRYKKGQFVVTLGNPYAIARDGSACAGWGLISNIARRPKPLVSSRTAFEKSQEETLHHMGTLLQIDGQLNLGTSGGAVLNRQGELIGIITAMAALEGFEKSVGYAVPINPQTLRVIEELAHGYEVEYGLLGITPETTKFPNGDQPTAVKVESAGSRSPAELAGVMDGDLIYGVNGIPIYTQEDLIREVALIGPGRIAQLKLYRPQLSQWLTRNVSLTKWPVYSEKDIIATQHRHVWNNIHIDYATARYDFFGRQYRRAVLVTHLEGEPTLRNPESLRVGDFITHVNDQPVPTPQEFQKATEKLTKGNVTLRLIDRTVVVQVSE